MDIRWYLINFLGGEIVTNPHPWTAFIGETLFILFTPSDSTFGTPSTKIFFYFLL